MEAKRWYEIATANFDRYVQKRLVECCYVVIDNEIDERELSCLAGQMSCDSTKLHQAITISLSRAAKNLVKIEMSEEDMTMVMKQTAKLHIKENALSLINVKRAFGRIMQELNHHNSGLHISKGELYEFIKPLYLEAVEEIFSI